MLKHNSAQKTQQHRYAADLRVARCQFRFLRALSNVTLAWVDDRGQWRVGDVLWQLIKEFPRGTHTLYYAIGDGEFRPCPIDDFTKPAVIDALMRVRSSDLRSIATVIRKRYGHDGDGLTLDLHKLSEMEWVVESLAIIGVSVLFGDDRFGREAR